MVIGEIIMCEECGKDIWPRDSIMVEKATCESCYWEEHKDELKQMRSLKEFEVGCKRKKLKKVL